MGGSDEEYDELEASLDQIDTIDEDAVAPPGVAGGAGTGRRDLADRVTARFFWLCEHPMTSRRVLRMVEASVSDAESASRFYGFLNRRMDGMVGRRMTLSASRMELVGAQLVGTAMLRYVLLVEPVASMPLERLLPMVAAGVRGLLGAEPGEEAADPDPPERLAGPGSADVVEAWMQVKRGGRPF
ncbi:hypothetical protein [Nocardioides sp. AE5]|uniref:TetR/AcrR family transcriptional regulator n=1 Tax=Nocardioides sp. AE5 TaxID=2962573 RepID=UPI002881414D|nr:hypothetical protein [Nocardioides sp. AE5]MDT0201605.1 hypothetical protein [Nocardioides sp. AE5]